ncbi:hypothetical protein ACNKHW_13095 [Shigella flexneri]
MRGLPSAPTWPEGPPERFPQVEKLISGEINTYSWEMLRQPQWRCRLASLAVSLVRHTDGTPLYFIAQIEDITS